MLNPGAFEERRTLTARLTVLSALAAVCMAALAVSFWVLQIAQHRKYSEMAENNHLRTIPLRAPRGVLFDRTGRVIVENKFSFTIAIVRENSTNLDEAADRLARATGEEAESIRNILRRHRTEPSFRPIPVIEHATFSQVAAVMARKLELPEVVVQQLPTRTYPANGFAAHLFGYVGEIQEWQLDRPEFDGLIPGAIVGQAGLEKTYNPQLQGRDGNRFVVVNSRGREIEELHDLRQDPVDGVRMQLTIDYDLQRALEEGFKASGFAGAAVFLDPNTGEVLAMTSQPEYDPNDFADGLEGSTWSKLTNDPNKPLQNRLIQGRYSPGSTFKILMATTALSEGVITPDFQVTCNGTATFYGHVFHCDKKEGHGTLDLRHAIEKSCNIYFYTVGNMLKIDTIHDYAARLGLIGKTGIDLPGESDSLVPSTEWKMKTFGERWYPGETISVAIGQGAVAVTPISMATMVSTVANGGTVVTPHVVKAVDEGQGWRPLGIRPPRALFPLKPEVLGPVRDGLWLVVNGAGTGSRAKIVGYDVSGKTGTAQVISREGFAAAGGKTDADLRDNGWFVFFAPRDDAQIAGVVFAEHAGHGGTAAAPIAKYVLETFFAKKEGRSLPVWPATVVKTEAALGSGLELTASPTRAVNSRPDPPNVRWP